MQNSDDFNMLLTDVESYESPLSTNRPRIDSNKEIFNKIQSLEVNQQNLTKLVARLTEEVILTRREVKKLVDVIEISKEEILPMAPLNTVEAFLNFDDDIKDPRKSKILVGHILRKVCANSGKEFVFKCWRVLITDSVAKEFNWSGQNNKQCVAKLACTAALQESFLTKYKEGIEIFHQKTKQFFTYASDRETKREKYKKSKDLPELPPI